MINQAIQLAAKRLARSEWAYNKLEASAGRAIDFCRLQRRMHLETFAKSDPFIDSLGLTVLNGPFRGMKYPNQIAKCSTFPPKIIGSYESELTYLIEEYCLKVPPRVIDIGCAEGYYAVGMALRCKDTEVWAFDTDPIAQEACFQMAKHNGVADQLHISGFCRPSDLVELCRDSPALIICDCEGYESTLFTTENVHELSHCELLIEAHDFIDPGISPALISAFTPTHHVSSIFSVDDIIKAQTYQYEELAELPLPQRRALLAEHRPCVMRWLHLSPRRD